MNPRAVVNPSRRADLADTPAGYAAALLYLNDASTIRVRVLDQYGTAPPRETIEAMLRGRAAAQDAWRRNHESVIGEPEDCDAIDFRPGAASHHIAVVRATQARKPKVGPVVPVWLGDRPLTAADMVKAVAARGDLTLNELTGWGRRRRLVEWRSLLAALLVAQGASMPRTGHRIGGRDHSTVLNLLRRFFARSLDNPEIAAAWQDLAPCVLKAARTHDEFQRMRGNPWVGKARTAGKVGTGFPVRRPGKEDSGLGEKDSGR